MSHQLGAEAESNTMEGVEVGAGQSLGSAAAGVAGGTQSNQPSPVTNNNNNLQKTQPQATPAMPTMEDELEPVEEPGPSAKEQDQILSKYKNASIVPNQTYYVIPSDWYASWELWTARGGFLKPGKIDTTSLVDTIYPELVMIKKDCREPDDYRWVAEEPWKILVRWYGLKGPAISRKSEARHGYSSVPVHPYRIPVILYVYPTTATTINGDQKQKEDDQKENSTAAAGGDSSASKEEGGSTSNGNTNDAMQVDTQSSSNGATATSTASDGATNTQASTTTASGLIPTTTKEEGEKKQFKLMIEWPSCPVKTFKARIAQLLGVQDAAKIRLWDHYSVNQVQLISEAGSLHDANIVDNNEIMVEFINPEKQSFTFVSRSSYVTSSAYGTSSSYYQQQSQPRPVVPGKQGLGNLGNTCFMNSGIQCLSACVPLTDFFLTQAYVRDVNRDNPIGAKGEIAEAFGKLLTELWSSTSTPSSSYYYSSYYNHGVEPRELKRTIERFASQFQGYNQHDSQELLAFLLDGLHEDLNRILRKPFVEAVTGTPDDVDADVAAKAWDGHKRRNDSIIVDNFQGQLKSKVVCPHCGNVSITFDPFMYLSLPMPIDNTRNVKVVFIPLAGNPSKHSLVLKTTQFVSDIFAPLAEQVNELRKIWLESNPDEAEQLQDDMALRPIQLSEANAVVCSLHYGDFYSRKKPKEVIDGLENELCFIYQLMDTRTFNEINHKQIDSSKLEEEPTSIEEDSKPSDAMELDDLNAGGKKATQSNPSSTSNRKDDDDDDDGSYRSSDMKWTYLPTLITYLERYSAHYVSDSKAPTPLIFSAPSHATFEELYDAICMQLKHYAKQPFPSYSQVISEYERAVEKREEAIKQFWAAVEEEKRKESEKAIGDQEAGEEGKNSPGDSGTQTDDSLVDLQKSSNSQVGMVPDDDEESIDEVEGRNYSSDEESGQKRMKGVYSRQAQSRRPGSSDTSSTDSDEDHQSSQWQSNHTYASAASTTPYNGSGRTTGYSSMYVPNLNSTNTSSKSGQQQKNVVTTTSSAIGSSKSLSQSSSTSQFSNPNRLTPMNTMTTTRTNNTSQTPMQHNNFVNSHYSNNRASNYIRSGGYMDSSAVSSNAHYNSNHIHHNIPDVPPPSFPFKIIVSNRYRTGKKEFNPLDNSPLDLQVSNDITYSLRFEDKSTYLSWINETALIMNSFISHPSFKSGSDRLANSGNKPALPLKDCIDLFTSEEKLTEENTWYCNKCQDHVMAIKKLELWSLPRILVIHLKRFHFGVKLRRDKIDDLVDFPLDNLDMTPYLLGHLEGLKVDDLHLSDFIPPPPPSESDSSSSTNTTTTTPSNTTTTSSSFVEGSEDSTAENVSSPNLSTPVPNTNKPPRPPPQAIYELFAVSNHFGGLGGGHYTAYGKHRNDSSWYYYDDSSVRPANEEDVKSKAAYVLFYRRKDVPWPAFDQSAIASETERQQELNRVAAEAAAERQRIADAEKAAKLAATQQQTSRNISNNNSSNYPSTYGSGGNYATTTYAYQNMYHANYHRSPTSTPSSDSPPSRNNHLGYTEFRHGGAGGFSSDEEEGAAVGGSVQPGGGRNGLTGSFRSDSSDHHITNRLISSSDSSADGTTTPPVQDGAESPRGAGSGSPAAHFQRQSQLLDSGELSAVPHQSGAGSDEEHNHFQPHTPDEGQP